MLKFPQFFGIWKTPIISSVTISNPAFATVRVNCNVTQGTHPVQTTYLKLYLVSGLSKTLIDSYNVSGGGAIEHDFQITLGNSGDYTVGVSAIDTKGNLSQEVYGTTLTIDADDTLAPTGSVTVTYLGNGTLQFDVSASDTESGIDYADVKLYEDGVQVPLNSITVYGTGSTNEILTGTFDISAYANTSLKVGAVIHDKAGNQSTEVFSTPQVFDVTPPSITTNTFTYSGDQIISYDFSITDDSGLGTCYVDLYDNTDTFQERKIHSLSGTSATASGTFTISSTGGYYIKVTSYDTSNNTKVINTSTINITDITDPVFNSVTWNYSGNGVINYDITVSDNIALSKLDVYLYKDSSVFGTHNYTLGTTPTTYNAVNTFNITASGTYYISAVATDTSNNTYTYNTSSSDIDADPPTVSFTDPVLSYTPSSKTISFSNITVSDTGGVSSVTVHLQKDGVDVDSTTLNYSGQTSVTPTGSFSNVDSHGTGNFRVRVVATDASNNTSSSYYSNAQYFDVINPSFTSTSISKSNGASGQAWVNYSATATDTDSSISEIKIELHASYASYAVVATHTWPNLSSVSSYFTVTSTGTYYITYTAKDSYGNTVSQNSGNVVIYQSDLDAD